MQHEQEPPREPATVSRRKLIVTGAGMAAAGLAVGAAASIPLGGAMASASDAPGEDPKLPVMVHLRSAKDGTFDVFYGTRRVQVTDRAFAARLTGAVSA
jgi:hypothetical protein